MQWKMLGNDVAVELEDLVDLENLVETRIPYKMPWDFRKRPWVFSIYAHGMVFNKIRVLLMG
jgi:hypothetical protein